MTTRHSSLSFVFIAPLQRRRTTTNAPCSCGVRRMLTILLPRQVQRFSGLEFASQFFRPRGRGRPRSVSSVMVTSRSYLPQTPMQQFRCHTPSELMERTKSVLLLRRPHSRLRRGGPGKGCRTGDALDRSAVEHRRARRYRRHAGRPDVDCARAPSGPNSVKLQTQLAVERAVTFRRVSPAIARRLCLHQRAARARHENRHDQATGGHCSHLGTRPRSLCRRSNESKAAPNLVSVSV